MSKCLHAEVTRVGSSVEPLVSRRAPFYGVSVAKANTSLSHVVVTCATTPIPRIAVTRAAEEMISVVTRATQLFNATISTLCDIDLIDKDRQVYRVLEGAYILADGKRYKVLKDGLSG